MNTFRHILSLLVVGMVLISLNVGLTFVECKHTNDVAVVHVLKCLDTDALDANHYCTDCEEISSCCTHDEGTEPSCCDRETLLGKKIALRKTAASDVDLSDIFFFDFDSEEEDELMCYDDEEEEEYDEEVKSCCGQAFYALNPDDIEEMNPVEYLALAREVRYDSCKDFAAKPENTDEGTAISKDGTAIDDACMKTLAIKLSTTRVVDNSITVEVPVLAYLINNNYIKETEETVSEPTQFVYEEYHAPPRDYLSKLCTLLI